MRRPLVRLLWWTGALGGGLLAVVGGLGLRGAGLVAVGVAAMLAASTAVGITRDEPGSDGRAVVEAAVQAAAWTTGVLLALAGVATLVGGLVALLTGVLGGLVWLVVRFRRSWTPLPTARPSATNPPLGADVLLLPPPDHRGTPAPQSPPSALSTLTTAALGREWLRTTAALSGRLPATDRAALVRRREETLDELERRDPAGFARWLADGPVPGSDPAGYVQARPVHEDPTAGTDAA